MSEGAFRGLVPKAYIDKNKWTNHGKKDSNGEFEHLSSLIDTQSINVKNNSTFL